MRLLCLWLIFAWAAAPAPWALATPPDAREAGDIHAAGSAPQVDALAAEAPPSLRLVAAGPALQPTTPLAAVSPPARVLVPRDVGVERGAARTAHEAWRVRATPARAGP